MDKDYADYLVKKTQEDYNTIAEDFDRTRGRLWEGMERFAAAVDDGDAVLDFGCGNGRLLELFEGKTVDYTGIDQSRALIERARARHPNTRFLCGEGSKLPFEDASFDAVFAIAVMHHIPSVARREELLAEIRRILKPGGRLVITAWNLWQRKYFPLMVKHTLKKLTGQSKMDYRDILVPWHSGSGAVMGERYYHCFTRDELYLLVEGAGFIVRERGFFGGLFWNRNIYLVAVKE